MAAASSIETSSISLVAFLTALSASIIIFAVQSALFLLLRGKLARIFKPKTYLVPENQRTEPPPASPWGMVNTLLRFRDREIIQKCGLDAYFFLRYLQTLLFIFVPMLFVVVPILIPINYVGGIGQDINTNITNATTTVSGLDVLSWENVRSVNSNRYWAHVIMACLVIIWVCGVFFAEMRTYIKVRQDWLTTAEHRLRASATTVLVSSIPEKWLTEEALRGLFDVFPGGIRNVWLTRDFSPLLDKIKKRDEIHLQLESAQTDLIRMAKQKQLKKQEMDEKKARKAAKVKALTRNEKAQRNHDQDEAAKQRAQSGGGASSGDQGVPHSIDEGLKESDTLQDQTDQPARPGTAGTVGTAGSVLSSGFSKLTSGIGKTGQGIFGGAKNIFGQMDNQIETTNGFVAIGPPPTRSPSPTKVSEGRHVQLPDDEDLPRPSTRGSGEAITRAVTQSPASRHSHHGSVVSQESMLRNEGIEMKQYQGNTVRKMENPDDMYEKDKTHWYQFWKPPTGGFASPVPQAIEGGEFPFKKEDNRTLGQKIKSWIPFMSGKDEEPIEYPNACNPGVDEDSEEGAEWQKWLKKSDRPTHRRAAFEWTPGWLPGLPFLNEKVDTIYWCRKELARLNMEIEDDQAHPDRFPRMKSAFIQFNHQVAAHMACQNVMHHIPRHMAPRTVEISPNDVIWDNMAISWWEEWARTAAVVCIVVGMLILWTPAVTFSASLSQITSLISEYHWLHFLRDNPTVYSAVRALAGILPAILLAILLILAPIIMGYLAGFKGAKTGAQKSETLQVYYFAFLFFQVFLVVSITAGAANAVDKLSQEAQQISNNPLVIASIAADSLPKAANYFFSYMLLQALSTSSGTLLQIGALLSWYVIAKITNNTARSKWKTNITLPKVEWGSYFPVYTNFACITLVYAVVSPLICIFAVITFSLLWMANRYSMIYVNRFVIDTGGALYPRALNQTFTGLYVMEICLIGLLFLETDGHDNLVCVPQASIMIAALCLTAIYQFLLNHSFGPLLRYLPITFEDEAVLRDEAFKRAQEKRLGLIEEDSDEEMASEKEHSASARLNQRTDTAATSDGAAEDGQKSGKFTKSKPVRGLAHAGSLAMRGGKNIKDHTYGRANKGIQNAVAYRQQRRQKDLEAQRAIGEALYGGFNDEIEDLTPEERDTLVQRAFQHSALRARRPTVWIPDDDIGVSNDEVARTKRLSDYIWISSEGTALDSKTRVVYGRAPPDFSELDLISL